MFVWKNWPHEPKFPHCTNVYQLRPARYRLTDQISGQLEAGFNLTNRYEDNRGGTNKIADFFPAFIATRAVKRSY